jgi:hypothetical protein
MRADAPGTWDLVVSAPWLERRRLGALEEFIRLLADAIGEKSLQQFSRVVALNQRDAAHKAVLSAFSVDDGEIRVGRSNLFGLEIEDAVILRAKRAA